MSKNITISEGSQAKNFTSVSKIRTNLIGGGTQDWIPEEEAGMYANLGIAEIDKNGTYKASDESLDGFSQVTVSVQPKTATKTITKNGTYKAKKDKVDGYDIVDVQVPSEGGGSGTTLITKTITANGTYDAGDDNADGYSSVTVNVSTPPTPPTPSFNDYYYPITRLNDSPIGVGADCGPAEYNGKLYIMLSATTLYTFDENGFTQVCEMPSGKTAEGAQLVVYNNELWLFGASNNGTRHYNQTFKFNGSSFDFIGNNPSNGGLGCNYAVLNGLVHNVNGGYYTFDGATWTNIGNSPASNVICSEYNGQLYAWNYADKKLYVYNGSWSEVAVSPTGAYGNSHIFPHKGKLHLITNSQHYSYNGRWFRTEETPINAGAQVGVLGDSIYIFGGSTTPTSQYVSKATYTE